MRKTDHTRQPPDYWMQTDVILPVQLDARTGALGEPERRLRLAVLEDAVDQLQRYANATSPRERAIRDTELDWFASDDRTLPFSFASICDALHIDPQYVRAGLREFRPDAPYRRTSRRRVSTPTPMLGGRRTYRRHHGRAA
jgi:hypothetical protein